MQCLEEGLDSDSLAADVGLDEKKRQSDQHRAMRGNAVWQDEAYVDRYTRR